MNMYAIILRIMSMCVEMSKGKKTSSDLKD